MRNHLGHFDMFVILKTIRDLRQHGSMKKNKSWLVQILLEASVILNYSGVLVSSKQKKKKKEQEKKMTDLGFNSRLFLIFFTLSPFLVVQIGIASSYKFNPVLPRWGSYLLSKSKKKVN